jgi:hypothetical protein
MIMGLPLHHYARAVSSELSDAEAFVDRMSVQPRIPCAARAPGFSWSRAAWAVPCVERFSVLGVTEWLMPEGVALSALAVSIGSCSVASRSSVLPWGSCSSCASGSSVPDRERDRLSAAPRAGSRLRGRCPRPLAEWD